MKMLSIVFVVGLTACSKSETSSTPSAASGSSSAARPATSLAASASASTAPAVSAAPSVGAKWTGTYEAVEGSLYVPDSKDWAGVKFRGEKVTTALGKGSLELVVDARGNATGTLEGPLGPAVLIGTYDAKAGTLAFRMDPKTPSVDAFYGTFLGDEKAGAVEGVLRASQSEARVIREAKVTLKKS